MFKQYRITEKVRGTAEEAFSLFAEAVLGSATPALAYCRDGCDIYTYSTCGACSGWGKKKYKTRYQTVICTDFCDITLVGCVAC